MTEESTPRTPARPGPGPVRGPPRRALRWVVAVVVLLALVVACVLGAGWWALHSDTGSGWLLSRVPGLTLTRSRGSLVGDFAAASADLRIPGSGRVHVDDLRWRGLEVGRAPAGLWLRIAIAELHAARVEWLPEPGAGKPAAGAPTSLALPFELDVAALDIGEADTAALGTTPVRNIRGALHLGAELGSVHRVEGVSLGWGRIRGTGSMQIATSAPLQLEARLELTQAGTEGYPAWTAKASAAGPLDAPLVQVAVRAEPSLGRPAQSLDARATVRPFAPWPLGDLEIGARALDLSTFHSALPVSALSGDASVRTHGMDQPSVVTANLRNASAGRWSDGRLPVRQLEVEIRARPDNLRALDLERFSAELGDAERPAGRIEGKGSWTPERWRVESTLAGVQAARLDARAPAMTLGGPLTLAAAGSGADAPIDVQGTLNGQLVERRTTRSVRLRLDASASRQRIEVREAEARTGPAIASFAGDAARVSDRDAWHIRGQTALVDFDPSAWAPPGDDSPWRKGPHRVNAKADLDLTMPAAIASMPLFDALAALRGKADATISNSVLAGVGIGGKASWRNDDGGKARATGSIDVAGNNVHFEGRIALKGDGADDAWDAALDAPVLARLAPLWRLFAAAPATQPPPSGALTANAHVTGRWPALATRGQLDASGLRVGPASVGKANARWQLGTSPDAPAEVEATLDQAALNGPSLESLRVALSGTAKAHRLDVQARSKALPPAWTDALNAAPPAGAAGTPGPPGPPATAHVAAPGPGARSVAVLQADGGLVGALDATQGWHGKIHRLEWRGNADGAATWVQASDIALDARWAGGPARISIQPGRAEVLGARLRWSRFAWQAAEGPAAPMSLDLQGELDPMPVVPLLRRFQPDFGWGGDLTIAGRFDIRSAPAVSADVVLERRAGDLTVTDEAGTQPLGLTDLRLGVAAADGVWNFTQAVAGRTLGVASGAVVARTAPGATWPSADTPIQGVLEVEVANLGAWGTWVPAGWRLGGELRTSASIGGRVGAPEYTGEIVGRSLSVRNFVQGVNVADGDVAIRLQGSTASIERFQARAGNGTVRLEGGASLGETPQARIALTADRFQLLGRVDRRIVTSGEAQLRLDRDTVGVSGRFSVDEGLIDFSRSDAPSLSDDVHVIRRGPAPGTTGPGGLQRVSDNGGPAAGGAAPRNLALDLRVDMGEHLRIRGRGLDSGLRGELHITSPAGRLAVNGTVSTVNGTYAAYGQKLTIDRGQLTFTGAIENPRLDIEATRPNLDIRVGVAVTGTALLPRVRLFSEPELSEMDKLSWLVLGRASEGLGRTDTALLQRAALALLSGEGGGMSDQFTKALGLDDVSVHQSEGEVRDTIVSLGKQLSRRWYVGYERGLNATAGSWQLIYRIARRFTLRAQSGADNSVDMIWTWRWQ